MPMNLSDLHGLNRKQLLDALMNGHPIDKAALDDTEYKGVSLGLPSWAEKLSWKTFKKTFHRDPNTGALRGWNVRIEQAGVDGAYEPKRNADGSPVTWGFYQVVPAEGLNVPHGVDQGLLIDYGLGGNGRFSPLSRLRDPLVAINPGNVELLLGWSYVDFGFARLGTPSFFSLSRDGALGHIAQP